MRKRFLALIAAVSMVVAAMAPAVYAEETEAAVEAVEGIQADADFYAKADLKSLDGKKIGITIQSLQNAYWAGVMSALEDVLKENGTQPGKALLGKSCSLILL